MRNFAVSCLNIIRRILGKPVSTDVFTGFTLTPTQISEAAKQIPGDFANLFFQHAGRPTHKWVQYLSVYDLHLARFRGSQARVLEIGVAGGGSLELWRKYFGPQAIIYGIDINPECANCVDSPTQVRIGSQGDEQFLKAVTAEMGSPDVVIDDGSHMGAHQRASFEALYPTMAAGGVYIIEDLHQGYWGLKGGYGKKTTGIEYIKRMIDDMHFWYHYVPAKTAAGADIGAIHIYDSIAVIDKPIGARIIGHARVGTS